MTMVSNVPPRIGALTDTENRRVKLFKDYHNACGKTIKIKIDHGSGIGPAVVVKCSGCGKKQDVTEYESW